ncbi:MAG TPA: MFS transporter [Verrucomicrobiae bacterium]|nr:MFS transporter [Verrucomicrobiae bacterium]
MEFSRKSAIRIIVLLGVLSMFSDITYEGARSVSGPYLAQLGVGAAIIGLVSGFGELVGYTLRLFSGYAADRTHAYWPLIISGVIVNLTAVPLLALTNHWEWAALLIIAERTGKAVRTPARDVVLSQGAGIIGSGWGFSLHEALDEFGAFIGPLAVAFVLAKTGQYHAAFAWLAIPAALGIATVFVARGAFPHPVSRESDEPQNESKSFPRAFWLYVAAGSLIALGFIDFPLIAYHFEKTKLIAQSLIPIYYAAATGVDAITVLIFGRAFDRFGLPVLFVSVLVSAAAWPLVFLGTPVAALIGMMCWGAGLGSHQSLLKASIAGLVPSRRRGSAYGIFNTAYGILWFAGSALAGFLYDRSVGAVVVFALAAQVAALPVLFNVRRRTA